MKSILTSITAGSLLAALAMAQPAPRYKVTDLGTLSGGTFSQATGLNNNGMVIGLSADAEGIQHSVVWRDGKIQDLGKSLLGGPNSGLFGINEKGQASGQAESSSDDPNSENFCGYGTGLKCLPFLWQDGAITRLPTLGGNNASVGQLNNHGELAGYAEKGTHDPDCGSKPANNGMGPQALDFEAVIWGPEPGQIRELQPLPGDTVGMAIWINDSGQAVGTSGTCATTILPPFPAVGLHAVLWEKDGSVHDLGNLGGTATTTMPAVGNIALSINNQSQIVGASILPGNTTSHAFLWTKEKGMQDLGTLDGDVSSAGLSINDRGEVVGPSVDAEGNIRPYVARNGVMTDLNLVVPEDFPLFLLLAFGVNNRGEIAGFGVQKSAPHDIHAFLATPEVTVAIAGPDGAISTTNVFQTFSSSFTFSAAKSASANPGALSYSWTLAPGYPSAAILSGNTATPILQLPSRATYKLILTVTDSTGTTAITTVTVHYS